MDFKDLNIVVGGAASVQNEVSGGVGSFLDRETPKRSLKERRKNKRDRRKSVREGIFVSLSVENDRRIVRDRRRAI